MQECTSSYSYVISFSVGKAITYIIEYQYLIEHTLKITIDIQ